MKRLLLLSDSHGMMSNTYKVKEKVGPVDLVLHMGDIEGNEERIRTLFAPTPVYFVAGNCDNWSCKEPAYRVLEVEGHRIFMAHGHHQDINWGTEGMESAAHQFQADLALHGHTHVPRILYRNDLMIINPGSIERPRQADHRPSFALLELQEGVFPCYCSVGYL